MSKRIKRLLVMAVIVLTVASVGVNLAFMFKKAINESGFTAGRVEIVLHEKTDGAEVTGNNAAGSEKSDIRVENTGNIKAFIRIKIVSYYTDAEGNIYGTISSEFPAITLQNGWFAGAEHTYYYPYGVAPGSMTEILCEPVVMGQRKLAEGEVLYQAIEVFAEAVQAEPASAAEEAWGVTVSDGEIRYAP